MVEGKHTVYRMSAGTVEEKDDWIACIRYATISIINRNNRVGAVARTGRDQVEKLQQPHAVNIF